MSRDIISRIFSPAFQCRVHEAVPPEEVSPEPDAFRARPVEDEGERAPEGGDHTWNVTVEGA